MKSCLHSLKFAVVLLLGAAILAACGGTEQTPPTETPEPLPSNTPDPAAAPTQFELDPPTPLPTYPTDDPSLQPEETGVDPGIILGEPGTLVAVGTVNPNLPEGFDRITLARTGGPGADQGAALDELIIIERDGTMTRNGVAGTASTEGIAAINAALNGFNFFAVQSNFLGIMPTEGEIPFRYQITLRQGDSERMITAQAGFIPAEIESLIIAVQVEGFKIDRQ